jgi:hypothetical protein
LTRQQLIVQTQTAFAQAMMQLDPSVPELFAKVRRPYEDTLRVLNVKDVDAYLPTIEEAAKIMQARAQQAPNADEQEKQSKVELNKASTQEKIAQAELLYKKIEDIDIDNEFVKKAAASGKLSAVEID